jgi:putative transposase
MRQRMEKIRYEMKNIINNLHWQTCSYLCKNFQTIIIPSFEVSKMVVGSPLGTKITRKMLGLSHGAFLVKLEWYCKTRGRNFKKVNEAYTTKTCGNCGTLHNMEGLKTLKCSSCGITIDRDFNGARNICLKTITNVV